VGLVDVRARGCRLALAHRSRPAQRGQLRSADHGDSLFGRAGDGVAERATAARGVFTRLSASGRIRSKSATTRT
jgi:hypothetical protein